MFWVLFLRASGSKQPKCWANPDGRSFSARDEMRPSTRLWRSAITCAPPQYVLPLLWKNLNWIVKKCWSLLELKTQVDTEGFWISEPIKWFASMCDSAQVTDWWQKIGKSCPRVLAFVLSSCGIHAHFVLHFTSVVDPDPVPPLFAGSGSGSTHDPSLGSGSIQIAAPDPDPPKFSGSGWIRIAPKQTKTLGKKS